MDIESLRDYCLLKEGAREEFPFGDSTIVFKTGGKIFLLAGLYSVPLQFNVKCDPERITELRERYSAVQPGYHMNKMHWNTVIIDGSLSDRQLKEMIDESYALIINSLPKKKSNLATSGSRSAKSRRISKKR
jgi:predicted DNA-binding protein (MmcQ/YjbR family)